jgi:hypothetical protein
VADELADDGVQGRVQHQQLERNQLSGQQLVTDGKWCQSHDRNPIYI